MKKCKLIEYPDQDIQRGVILHLRSDFGETVNSFLVAEVVGERSYQFMRINGYKAGITYWILPQESISKSGFGLSKDWLVENWSMWGMDGVLIDDVYIETLA